MRLTPLRSLRRNSARSTAISTHAISPRESSRFRRCARLRRIDARRARRASQCECQPTQPRDISRWTKYPKAFDIGPSPGAISSDHDASPNESCWCTMRLTPLRSLRRNSARSTAISCQPTKPRESSRFRRCARLRRIDSLRRTIAAHSDCQPPHPRDNSRWTK